MAELTRTVTDRRGTRREVVFLITSRPPDRADRADRAQLLAWIRGHWSVESRHWLRDVTFGEDRSRLRGGHAPQIMATLRTLRLTRIRRTGTTAIAPTRRAFAYRPGDALALLLPEAPPPDGTPGAPRRRRSGATPRRNATGAYRFYFLRLFSDPA